MMGLSNGVNHEENLERDHLQKLIIVCPVRDFNKFQKTG